MKNDITYEYRVFTNRRVDVDRMEVGKCTSKVLKELKQKDKVNGRFFHTSDTDEWFFCWDNKLEKINFKGNSLNLDLEEVKKIANEAKSLSIDATKSIKNKAEQSFVEDLNNKIPVKLSQLENDKNYTTTEYVDERVANLIDGAPETLDTLDELAKALKENDDVVDLLKDSIEAKANKSDVEELNKKVPTKVSQLENDSKYLTEHQDISGKQDKIDNLDEIIEGALKGNTALQESALEGYALKSYVSENYISNVAVEETYAKKADIPTVVSEFTNDAGYLIESNLNDYIKADDLEDYAKKSEIKTYTGGTNISIDNNNQISAQGYTYDINKKSISIGTNNSITQNNICLIGEGLQSAQQNQMVIGKYNTPIDWDNKNVPFIIGWGDINQKRTILAVQDGQCGSEGTVDGGLMTWGPMKAGASWLNADFGEYFEWFDGNPYNEDRIGYMVQLNNGKIELAKSFESCIGVISGTCAFVGGSCSLEWHGRFLKDEWGRHLYDEDNNLILNPEYDETLEYIPREQRKEWSPVGLIGQVLTRQDGTLEVGGFAGCKDGIATKSESGYRVLKIVNENVALLLVK